MRASVLALAGLVLCASLHAENAARSDGEPVLEPATLRSLGLHWVVKGDENRNAAVKSWYRKAGAEAWREALPLLRVERGAPERSDKKHGYTVGTPSGGWLFAGSLLLLEPDTEYEWKLALADPDGGEAEKVLKARTSKEPGAPEGLTTYHVVPGEGGGSGTEADPFKGLAAAQEHAAPGTLFLLGPGVYKGTFTTDKSGAEGKPIVWRGAGSGKTILDAQGDAKEEPGRGISCGDVHDVWFENLAVRRCEYGIVAHRSFRMVFRRLQIHEIEYGITWTNNGNKKVAGNWVLDCVLEGRATWPRSKGIEGRRGVQATGSGHVIAYNRISGFADAVDTFPSYECSNIDFHNNEVSEQTDDGMEMDYSFRNTRCFENRFTNVHQGITNQPVYGGPVYIFRNAFYNLVGEPFKLHNGSSGVLMLNNTVVKAGMPNSTYGGEFVTNCVSKNNLFIGTTSNYAYESTTPMNECDFDYDGYGGGPWRDFLKWNNVRYKTLEEAQGKGVAYKNARLVKVDGLFASGLKQPEDAKTQFKPGVNDLRLKEGAEALDAGTPLPGITDGFAGKAPDLGAYEFGAELPHYGPRPEK
ncbi:MAG: right-handed parallel beta-helix repeat-containing protein [Planctomycetota bacterium]|nr:right-handed parallel beta-helix repeat-containing protein [Planctomycetota bacterium]